MATQTMPLGLSDGFSLQLEADFFTQDTPNGIGSTFDQSPPDASTTSMLIPPTTTTSSKSSTNSPSYAPNSSGFSTFTLNVNNQHSPSSSSASSGTKRKAESPPEDDVAVKDLKRQRNTMAARKYRQKRLDRIAELEQALADMTGERDDLRLKLARREAEADALREMLAKK